MTWCSSPGGYIKVNVDSSSFRIPSVARFGGILRYGFGTWIHHFSGICGITSNLFGELATIWRGLPLAWNLSYSDNIVKSYFK